MPWLKLFSAAPGAGEPWTHHERAKPGKPRWEKAGLLKNPSDCFLGNSVPQGARLLLAVEADAVLAEEVKGRDTVSDHKKTSENLEQADLLLHRMETWGWKRKGPHKCLWWDGVRGRVGMWVPEGWARILCHTRSHCHQICPNRHPPPWIISAPTLWAPLLSHDGSAGCAVWTRHPAWRDPNRDHQPSPLGGRWWFRTQVHNTKSPLSFSPECNGHGSKRSVCRTLTTLVGGCDVPGSNARSSREGRGECALPERGPGSRRGSPRSASAGCFLSSFGSLPRRRNGIWRERGKGEREGEREGWMKEDWSSTKHSILWMAFGLISLLQCGSTLKTRPPTPIKCLRRGLPLFWEPRKAPWRRWDGTWRTVEMN